MAHPVHISTLRHIHYFILHAYSSSMKCDLRERHDDTAYCVERLLDKLIRKLNNTEHYTSVQYTLYSNMAIFMCWLFFCSLDYVIISRVVVCQKGVKIVFKRTVMNKTDCYSMNSEHTNAQSSSHNSVWSIQWIPIGCEEEKDVKTFAEKKIVL